MQISNQPQRIDQPSIKELIESPSQRVLAEQPVCVGRTQGVLDFLSRRATSLHRASLPRIDRPVQPGAAARVAPATLDAAR